MATNSSYVFNAQVISIDFSINNGAYVTLAGTDGSANWVPDSATIGFTPVAPVRGNLKWDKNIIQFMPSDGTADAQTLTFNIDETVNPQAQIQLYLFWQSATFFTLQVLVNGRLTYSGGSTGTASAA